MQQGTVKWFNNSKGFGFILQDGGNEDVFVHYSVIEGSGFRTLKEGERVTFDVTRGPKGLHAVTVRRVDGEDF
jgi:CspA family cold shock protein